MSDLHPGLPSAVPALAVLLALFGTLGCVTAAERRPSAATVAGQPPPPPAERSAGSVVAGPPTQPEEVDPSRQRAGWVWVRGYWHWTGVRHVWIPAHWQRAHPEWTWRAP